jgi:hypothetical protein
MTWKPAEAGAVLSVDYDQQHYDCLAMRIAIFLGSSSSSAWLSD